MKLKNVVVKNWWYDNCHIREYARESVKEWVWFTFLYERTNWGAERKKDHDLQQLAIE
jgi:hypothetical protein